MTFERFVNWIMGLSKEQEQKPDITRNGDEFCAVFYNGMKIEANAATGRLRLYPSVSGKEE